MKALAIVVAFAAAQAAAQAPADKAASNAETRAVADIVDCMVAGLPEDWRAATMEVNLEKPMDDTAACATW